MRLVGGGYLSQVAGSLSQVEDDVRIAAGVVVAGDTCWRGGRSR